ncbi:hypothetical protein AB1Y20_009499 [Prymnesium parvum]|uniref:Uncharacterized protein n=1 Tax=Prymnesium parvum TaxID=97485 RepID=A0AB34K4R6_PRYPA
MFILCLASLASPSPPVSPPPLSADGSSCNTSLTDRVPARIAGLAEGNSLLLGVTPTSASSSVHTRHLQGLYPHAPLSSGSLAVHVQSKVYLSETVRVATNYPTSLFAVLRTAGVWVDRVRVRVAYQLRDSIGNALVSEPYAVQLRVALAGDSELFACDTSSTQSSVNGYLGHCSALAFNPSWFASPSDRVANVSVVLRDAGNTRDVAVAGLHELTVHAQPGWWDDRLRSATIGNGLTAPTSADDTAGVFITLPASPLHPGESFEVYMYVNTIALPLTTWRVRLYFSDTHLLYTSFVQNAQFNSASVSQTAGGVSWLATGVKSTATNANVTGSAIYLLRATLTVLAATPAGTYGGATLGLYPRATELISAVAFAQDVDGKVFDRRDGPQIAGELTIVTSTTSGIFAYSLSGTLPNLAPLTGASSVHAIKVFRVGSDDRLEEEASEVSDAICIADADAPSVFELVGCNVTLGPSQTTGSTQSSVSVAFTENGSTWNASVQFSVYRPRNVTVSLDQSELKRIVGLEGESIPRCSREGRTAYPYQRTGIRALADGLDATPLVSFATGDADVAGVSSSRYNIIEGREEGTTTAYLSLVPHHSAQISVTDAAISASELVVRVVTSVTWAQGWQPPPQYVYDGLVVVIAQVTNFMTAEGDSGFMYSRVVYSDGHEEDVGYDHAPSIEEMEVSSGSSGVELQEPSDEESLWQIGVAVGAVAECLPPVDVDWTVCGVRVATGSLPLHLNLPDPTGAVLTISEARLTVGTDDAVLEPLSIPWQSALRVLVNFSDGSTRDMSTDSRVEYTSTDDTCASIDFASNGLTITKRAVCTSVTIVATVRLGSFLFVVNDTRPVVYLSHIVLTFSGYPDVDENTNLNVTTLGLVPGLPSTYFHAAAKVHAYLTDSATQAYEVTSQCSFSSSAPSIVSLASSSSTRMRGVSAGISTISAFFGFQTASSPLTVIGEVLDAASLLTWDVPILSDNTLRVDESEASTVSLAYASGLKHPDLTSSTYDSWIDITSLVSFSSSLPDVIAVSSDGLLTLLGNHLGPVTLSASVSGALPAVSASVSRFANLRALPLDVDFGSLEGLQFSHTPGSASLDVPVHITPASGTTLKSFQITLGPLDTSYLNSAAGASFFDNLVFTGIVTQFDNPSSEVVLSASDTSSTVASQATLGTIRLNVLRSGVTLITGEITSMVVQDSNGVNSELQYVPVEAGQGYVLLNLGRRRLFATEPLSSARDVAKRIQQRRSRHRLQDCSPCVSRVWGDFNGDCQFLASDVLALSEFVLLRELFERGATDIDPLLTYLPLGGGDCEFLKHQANPSHDLMWHAGTNEADPRYGRPAITGLDTQHLLYATVKKHRFLASMDATCNASSVSSGVGEDIHIVVHLKGGDGQNSQGIDASATYTDVYFELRVFPAPEPFLFEVAQAEV